MDNSCLNHIYGEELSEVYRELYSGDPDLQQHAIDRVAVWRCRSASYLPIAVESTASLIGAQLQQHNDNQLMVRQLYSMALIRFINHITEKGQTRQFPMSVHHLAAHIGLPDWIVDLRHEATHGALPSLSVLNAAVDGALNWLKTEYWERQTQSSSRQSTTVVAADTFRDLLVSYQQEQFAAQNNDGSGAHPRLMKDLLSVMKELRHGVCACLLESGYLVCTSEQLTSLGVSVTELLNGRLPLPEPLIHFWQPLFKLLEQCGLVVPLLLRMAAMVTETHSLRNKILCGWIYAIVKASQSKTSKAGMGVLELRRLRVPFKQLLNICLRVDSRYGKDLVLLLLDEMAPGTVEKSHIFHLQNILDIYHSEDGTQSEGEISKIHSVADLQQSTGKQNAWNVYMERHDWSSCPIGTLPNQEVGYKTLEIGHKTEVDMDRSVEIEEQIDTEEMESEPQSQMVMDDRWSEDQLKSIAQQICVF